MKVKDCMCNSVIYLAPENTVYDCAKLMNEKHIGCIPLCNNNQSVVGLITDRDIVLRGVACDKDIKNTMASDIMTCKVCCCKDTDEIEQVEKMMSNEQVRRLPVVDNNNKIIGIITLKDMCINQNVNTQDVSQILGNICGNNNKNAE